MYVFPAVSAAPLVAVLIASLLFVCVLPAVSTAPLVAVLISQLTDVCVFPAVSAAPLMAVLVSQLTVCVCDYIAVLVLVHLWQMPHSYILILHFPTFINNCIFFIYIFYLAYAFIVLLILCICATKTSLGYINLLY